MKIRPLIASQFASDGGTMFGLVPKPIWNKRLPADDRNRIAQHAHALLVELPDGRRGLVDTGCGPSELFSDRELEMHALGTGWPLRDELQKHGLTCEQIDFITFTHLHWDHAGSLVSANAAPVFPRAHFYIHETEWQDARSGDPLLYKSYPANLVAALNALPSERLHLLSDTRPAIAEGLELARSGGHTRGHCAVVARHAEVFAGNLSWKAPLTVFAGDVCPTQHHLRMVFQTSYDTYPLETRAWKRTWFPRLAGENGLLLFDHDPHLFGAFIREDPREEFAVDLPIPVKGA